MLVFPLSTVCKRNRLKNETRAMPDKGVSIYDVWRLFFVACFSLYFFNRFRSRPHIPLYSRPIRMVGKIERISFQGQVLKMGQPLFPLGNRLCIFRTCGRNSDSEKLF